MADTILQREQFERIGEHGIGNPKSGLAQAMCYHGGKLYVGVTHSQGSTPEEAARILRYTPETGEWEEIYRSPLVKADIKASAQMKGVPFLQRLSELRGQPKVVHEFVPRERGFRCITPVRKKGRDTPVLIASTMSHWGSTLMCSEDGQEFTAISEPGLGDSTILSFRCVVPFGDKLFISPVGNVKEDVLERNLSDIAKLYVSEDPFSGKWTEAMEPGFGDPTNLGIFSLTAYKGYLYAGTSNPTRGFEIWRTDARGSPPYAWERVIERGAYRYSLNHTASTLTEFKGKLYVSSALPGLGEDKTFDVGPAAAELLRIDENGDWDLLCGTPRFTPDGLKVPLSLMGPGFEDAENSVFWCIASHEGCLYAGSHHNTALRSAFGGAAEITGGFQLWATADGEEWSPVSVDGFGDPWSVGVRTMASTPHGLFLGTLNHRDVERFWLMRTGRRGQAVGVGGFDIYLARPNGAHVR